MANKPFKKLRFSLTGDTYSPVDEQARQNIGNLSQLNTTHKDNLVEAINEAAESGDGGTGIPSGGSKGQVLTKRSSVEGDADWEYPPVMYATGNDPSNLTVSWNENYSVMDFFMRQSIVQAEYEDSYVVHLKLIKAYITAVPPDFTSVYHFFFGAVTEITNGTAAFGTLEVICDNPSAHSGVGVYTEAEIGVSEEAIQDAVDTYLTTHPTATGTFTNAAKNALLDLLERVAYIDNEGQTYWNSLRQELFSVAVVSISATFEQGSAVIYDTDSLDVLKPYLTVVATYADSSTEEVSTYTLSGTLTEGTSTITVRYDNQTTTFNVTVTGYLPGIYQEVEYIDSSGTQYIETSVLSQIPLRMAAKSSPLANDIAPVIAAHNSSIAKSRFFLLGYPYARLESETSTTLMRAACRFSDDTPGNLGAGAWLGATEILSPGSICVTETEITQNGAGTTRKFTSNGATLTVNGNMPTLGYPIKLMIKPGSGTPVAMRVYYCKLYSEDVLLFDGIPCYRISDNVAGVFDAVSRTFLTNAGTGTFTVGPDV